MLRFPSSSLYLQRVWNDYSLAQSFGAGVLRPINASGRVSRRVWLVFDWCSACERCVWLVQRLWSSLIGAAPASRRKLLVAARHVVFCFRNVMCVIVQSKFFWLVKFRCYWSNPVYQRNLFVTAWSWYGHFSKILFSLNLWLVVCRLAVLYRHLSVNVSPQGNTTAFWDWSQVFGDRTFLVPGLYRTLSQ